MDVALALDVLVPGAQYGGSLTANTEEVYDAIIWQDERQKPSWEAIQSAQLPQDPLSKQLEDLFIQALQEHGNALPPNTEGDLFILKAGITEMLKFNRLAAAKAKIESVLLPDVLEPIRSAMLAKFNI